MTVSVAVPVVVVLLVAVLTVTTSGDDRHVRVVDSGPAPSADLWLLNSTPIPHTDVIDAASRAKRGVTLTGLEPHLRMQDAVRRGDVLVVDQAFGKTNAPNVFVVEPNGSSRPLGEGSAAVASADEERVWIVSRDATTIREVDLTGRETIAPQHLPPGFLVRAAVDAGLVGNEQSAANRQITSLSVWEPVTNTIVQRWPGSFLAAAGRTVVWNDQGGRVHLADARTGAERIVAPDEGISSVPAAWISPDGRTVALVGGGGGGFKLALLDVATARVTHVSGWAGQAFGSIGWSADSGWMYFAGARRDHDPFSLYAVRRGATKVTPLRVTVGNFEAATVGPGF